jgi:hypothetical protein
MDGTRIRLVATLVAGAMAVPAVALIAGAGGTGVSEMTAANADARADPVGERRRTGRILGSAAAGARLVFALIQAVP